MGKEVEKKCYAITATVKPQGKANVKYKAKTHKGIVFAHNPNRAKETTIDVILFHYTEAGCDGTSRTKPKVTRDDIAIKKCELFNGFLIKQDD